MLLIAVFLFYFVSSVPLHVSDESILRELDVAKGQIVLNSFFNSIILRDV